MIIRSKAPLRLGLAGGGTDVSPYSEKYGGYVLNATIDMYAYCTLELQKNGQIIFSATDLEEYYESELTDYLKLDGNLDLHKAIYNRIVKQFNNGIPFPVKLTTYSDAPAGSGLGSSSTMVVAIIKAFVEALSLPLGEYDIAHLAYEIERKDVGLSGGKQDQYAATFGGFNFMEFYKNDRVIVNPLRIKKWIINELESSMILYYTGISRESAKIIDEQTRNVIEKKEQSLIAMEELKADALAMKESLLKGNIQALAFYLGKSWDSKKKIASTISNHYLEDIYKKAINAGAYAGKVSGAGGGGFMMFIVDPTKRLQVIKSLRENGGAVMDFHFVKHGTQGWRIE
ncbi:GHMP kinase [Cytobacillus oceanisediminis]|uniref:GHMP family kinase ATP-binding protein n=1 Tax=Cytobacillus oceanisediminis TaxID=665099 RepID=UPI001D137142|nr:GHMP kinase [Cytobacillus oceanisediminis]MCC3646350.1 GHMP kinase [Cytobacillus oceanisediminis]